MKAKNAIAAMISTATTIVSVVMPFFSVTSIVDCVASTGAECVGGAVVDAVVFSLVVVVSAVVIVVVGGFVVIVTCVV